MHHHTHDQHGRRLACIGTLGFLLAECGDNRSTPARPPTASLIGIAAPGGAIAGGNFNK